MIWSVVDDDDGVVSDQEPQSKHAPRSGRNRWLRRSQSETITSFVVWEWWRHRNWWGSSTGTMNRSISLTSRQFVIGQMVGSLFNGGDSMQPASIAQFESLLQTNTSKNHTIDIHASSTNTKGNWKQKKWPRNYLVQHDQYKTTCRPVNTQTHRDS